MHSSDRGTIHIIGAGLAGLAAGERLSQSHQTVAIHEATAQAGGRCRSYYDQATGMLIDNGTHLLLSGNHAALSFTEAIGSRQGLRGPKEAQFPFIELQMAINGPYVRRQPISGGFSIGSSSPTNGSR
jgi:protoporphyrinogen oxidase